MINYSSVFSTHLMNSTLVPFVLHLWKLLTACYEHLIHHYGFITTVFAISSIMDFAKCTESLLPYI